MKRNFIANEFYHISNQGIDKNKIFLDKNDHIRFIHNLYEFNNAKPASEFVRRYKIVKIEKKNKNVGSQVSHKSEKDKRDKLVNLYAFALMPNSHHLLAEQTQKNGISLFMRKVHTGYTNSFNLKHKRSGHLFQGTFKSVHIKDDIHLGFMICYLHSNALDFWKKNWREKKLNDLEIKQALKFLDKYKYSSHLDYAGNKISSSIISKQFLLEFFDGTKGYKEFFTDWLKQYQKNIKYIKNLTFQ